MHAIFGDLTVQASKVCGYQTDVMSFKNDMESLTYSLVDGCNKSSTYGTGFLYESSLMY